MSSTVRPSAPVAWIRKNVSNWSGRTPVTPSAENPPLGSIRSRFDLCHRLRRELPALAVVFLTARDSVEDRLTGFDLGGDDYVTKPFSVAEVVARVNAVLRRGSAAAARTGLVVGDLELDEDAHVVRRGGRTVELSPTEFRLLRLLMENRGRVLSKQQILQQVWQYDFVGDAGAVEKYVSRLRRKVDEGHDVALLHTVRGFGYVLREPLA